MKTPFLILLITSMFACSTATGAPTEDSSCGELLCDFAGGKADGFDIGEVVLDRQVSWDYSLDRGAEHREGTGRVVVRFFHRELPLADSGVLSQAESALQPAVVTLELPSFDHPEEMESLEFLAMLQTWDGGQSYSVDGVDGQGAWFSTSLPDVVERFNNAYDFTTQSGTGGARVDAKFAFSSIRFARTAGNLTVDHISMVFAEPFGDTRRFDRVMTGRSVEIVDADAQRAAEEMFFRDGPLIREHTFTPTTYSLHPGTIRVLDVDNLRDAAELAAQHSLENRTAVVVFEEAGLFASGELRFTHSGNRVPAVVAAFYEPSVRFEPIHPNGPVLIVDHSIPYFNLGLCELTDEPTAMTLGRIR